MEDVGSGVFLVAEVQIKTPEMHKAAEAGHLWYERSRELEGQYQHAIPPDRLGEYHLALSEQLRLYGDAAAVTDPEILDQLVDKFMKGGAVVAGPRFFRMSFQN